MWCGERQKQGESFEPSTLSVYVGDVRGERERERAREREIEGERGRERERERGRERGERKRERKRDRDSAGSVYVCLCGLKNTG